MGLDITAYAGLRPAPEAELDEEGYPKEYDRYVLVSKAEIDGTEKDFPGRTEGLETGVFGFSDEFGFRAGSYGYHSRWRDELAKLAGYESAEIVQANPPAEGPFVELINFSDCEGVIGPVVARRLLHAFIVFRPTAETYPSSLADFLEVYDRWLRGCRLAAAGGLLDFH